MIYSFVPMNLTYAKEIVENWKYPNEYYIYDYDRESDWILSEEDWGSHIFAVLSENNELIGELSVQFYDSKEVVLNKECPNAKILWVGFGLRPDLTGKGYGENFVKSCVNFAIAHNNYKEKYVGLGVYKFNQRAIKTYKRAGFEPYNEDSETIDGTAYEAFYMRKKL